MGDAKAIARLDVPEIPACVEYLRDWSYELYGRSGIGMGGLMPLSYSTIADWSRLKDIHPKPYEIEALIAIDAAMLNPGED
jgi:hypothetical protein